jgi:hypothetical protein
VENELENDDAVATDQGLDDASGRATAPAARRQGTQNGATRDADGPGRTVADEAGWLGVDPGEWQAVVGFQGATCLGNQDEVLAGYAFFSRRHFETLKDLEELTDVVMRSPDASRSGTIVARRSTRSSS